MTLDAAIPGPRHDAAHRPTSDRWDLLDSLPQLACVVDVTGRIVRVNRAWVLYGRSHGLHLDGDGVGANYLDACRVRTGDEAEQAARAVAAGLRTILRSGEGRFSLEYPELGDGDEETVWAVSIVPSAGDTAIVQHWDVTLQRQAERRRAVELALAEQAGVARFDEDARRRLVARVATAAGWEAATVWGLPSEGPPALRSLWRLDPRARLSERPAPVPAGVDAVCPLVTRVVEESAPCWLGPLDAGSQHVAEALFGTHHRLRSAFAVPHRAGPDDDRVVVFYARSSSRPDLGLLELVGRAFGHARSIRRSGIVVTPLARFDGEVPGSLVGTLESASRTDDPVLVEGEEGTGKRTLARGIHAASARADGPFLVLDCAAHAPAALEASLFGDGEGPSVFDRAQRGTLVLHRIDHLDADLQGRLLETLVVTPRTRDVRMMATSTRLLGPEVEAGGFREELYFALNVVEVRLQPLRERPWDVPRLAEYMLRGLTREDPAPPLPPGIARALRRQPWPGNVAQLRRVLERAVALADGGELTEQLVNGASVGDDGSGDREEPLAVESTRLEALERDHVRRVLAASRYNMRRAAEALGISRSTLYERARRYGIDLESERRRARGA